MKIHEVIRFVSYQLGDFFISVIPIVWVVSHHIEKRFFYCYVDGIVVGGYIFIPYDALARNLGADRAQAKAVFVYQLVFC